MRLSPSSKVYIPIDTWRIWFAWYPVRAETSPECYEWRWLERVWWRKPSAFPEYHIVRHKDDGYPPPRRGQRTHTAI